MQGPDQVYAELGVDALLVLVEAYREAAANKVSVVDVCEVAAIACRKMGSRTEAHEMAVQWQTLEGLNLSAVLNEAKWLAVRKRTGDSEWAGDSERPQWSEDVGRLVSAARQLADQRGVSFAQPAHLAAAAADSTCANEATALLDTPGEPYLPMVDAFEQAAVVELPDAGWFLRAVSRFMFRLLGRATGQGSPVLRILEKEIVRQAVRTGSGSVNTTQLILATLSTDTQMSIAGRSFAPRIEPANRGAKLLGEQRLTLPTALKALPANKSETDVYSREEAKRFIDGTNPMDPIWGRRAGQMIDAATEIKNRQSHFSAGTTHLLAAILADHESMGRELLLQAGLDLAELTARTEHALTACN